MYFIMHRVLWRKLKNLVKKKVFFCVVLLILLQYFLWDRLAIVSVASKPFSYIPVLQFWVEDSENASVYEPLSLSQLKQYQLLAQDERVRNEFYLFHHVIDRNCFQKLSANFSLQEYRNDAIEFDERKRNMKKILVWNYRFGGTRIGFGYGDGPFKKACCKESRCFLTGNRDLIPLEEFDAIVFHFYVLSPRNLPSRRSEHQRWIFYEMEAPAYNFHNPDDFAGVFNWTMTYRIDSDIPIGYGYVYPKEIPARNSSMGENVGESTQYYTSSKTKLAAWMVSHCKTQSYREYYVTQLQKYINVDIYGNCGESLFPKQDKNNFYEMFERDYKFYLSFENALCKDYATEKLFNILRYNIVPVVYGFADYKRWAPPHSYVDILDFKNLEEVAQYLLYLDKNLTAYNEYFRWKEDFGILLTDNIVQSKGFCSLCKRLHSDSPKKTYHELRKWHVDKAKCKRMRPAKWYEKILGVTLD